jgi:glucose-fructose oxidoreductase
MTKIRYAVVGLGSIAQAAVLPAFENAENCELAALVSGDPIKNKELGERYNIRRTYSYEQYEDCLKEVDAVYIALPNHLHCEYTVCAARRGVHVLCEKPMAPTEHDCELMIDAAEQHDVKLMIAYRLHFEEANLEAIRIAQSGQLGDLRIFSSVFAQQIAAGNVRIAPEPGRGVVFDMGVYCINAARYLFREEPVEVLAFTANNGEDRFQDSEEMASFGAAATDSFTIVGTKGRLRLEPAYEYAGDIKHYLTIGEKTREQTFPKRDQFGPELYYFSDCLLNNCDPEPSGEEGYIDVRVVNAIYKSAKLGTTIQVPRYERARRPEPAQNIERPPVEPPEELVHAEMPSGEKKP